MSSAETVHQLKTHARYWDAVENGSKTFEVRRNDRAFQTGDILELEKVENDPPHAYVTAPGHRFSKMVIRKRVSYLLQGGQFGIDPAFCVLGLQDVEEPTDV